MTTLFEDAIRGLLISVEARLANATNEDERRKIRECIRSIKVSLANVIVSEAATAKIIAATTTTAPISQESN